MNILRIASMVARDFPGGIAALAKKIGRNPTTFAHELNPPAGSLAKLGLATAVDMSEAANDDRVLFAWAVSRGYCCLRIKAPEGQVTRADLMARLSKFVKENADPVIAMHKAMEDGHITQREIQLFVQEFFEAAPAAIALADSMSAIAAEQSRARATGRASYQPRQVAAVS